MEIVLSTPSLGPPGGTQSYLLTICPHLERLGHNVTLFSPELGTAAELARSRGLRVAGSEQQLPNDCDAVIAQDRFTALLMTDRYPKAVRVIVVHSTEYDLHLPPGLDGVVSCAVVMNDAVARRVRAMATKLPVRRLRQPIDPERNRPVGVIRDRPAHVLMLGNYLDARGRDALVRACEQMGLSCRHIGLHGEQRADPFNEISDADVVIGQGRSILEAMACGRAAWVYGPTFGDGWVTPDTYPALEADGFRGRATDAVLNADSFIRGLDHYDPSMGAANRKLARLRHSPHEHAVELVEALESAPAGRAVDAPLRELARALRVQYEALGGLEEVSRALQTRNEEREALLAENARLTGELSELYRRSTELRTTRRWRAMTLALRPLDLVRTWRNERTR